MGNFKAYESLLMISGKLQPPNILDHNNVDRKVKFFDLVTQIALEKAIEIYQNPKVIPALSANPSEAEQKAFDDASNYLNKIYRTADKIIDNDGNTFRKLLKLVVTQFSELYNFQVFVTKTQEGNINYWETRTTESMLKAIELLSGIKADEKTAYDNII